MCVFMWLDIYLLTYSVIHLSFYIFIHVFNYLFMPPLLCICRCTDNQNINTLGVYQSPSNAISANIAASVSDIQRPKELIDEYVKLNISRNFFSFCI